MPFNFSNGDETLPRKKLREVEQLTLSLDNRRSTASPGATSRAHDSADEGREDERDSANEGGAEARDSGEHSRGAGADGEDQALMSRTPWFRTSPPYPKDLLKMLHEEILDFARFISPTEAEHNTRLHVIGSLAKVITELWPTSQVKVFGSFDTRLYLPTSDIDVVVLLEGLGVSPPPLHRLAVALQEARIASQIKVLDKARVPIIKLKDSLVGIDIDISFNTRNGIKAAEIIKEKIKEFPALRPLAFVIKQFLLQRNLNEVFTGGLSSYSVLCLIISLLQLHPKLQRGEIKAGFNLGVLLIEFFELYGRLVNYSVVGISIREQGSYYDKNKKYHYPYQPHLLSIEDPQDPGMFVLILIIF